MKLEYKLGLGILILVGLSLLSLLLKPSSPIPLSTDKQAGTPYIEIVNPSGFVNTAPLTLEELVGKKIILVDFLTYSCINCQRTFPYLNAWYEKYRNDGLEIVGIHTPEFAFEKDINNVKEAMTRFGITHPIVLDNDYATWNAYGNRYWPRKYLIDISGNIVYDHIGEGGYEETEMKIRELLEERSQVLGSASTIENDPLASAQIQKIANAAKSPETYFGSLRNEYLGSGTPGTSGAQTFELPEKFSANTLYLGGGWNITPEYAESVSNSRVIYRYYAKEVYLVAESPTLVKIEVWQDGKLVSDSSGADLTDGEVRIGESRLYKLINNPEAGEHVLELRIKGKGARLYAFTFG